ncbi:unnamed protein product [Caenorhabditis angaria]|uniref:G-protein coupled receptors family 1 profile domain-containing protein n=1 Tax=Caenorhabditis angaria TaxID=860376 RepID=A0A9P1N7Z0_9PELO|nr:unnamed protein product [Caenorhabditis angaria]
MLAYIEAFCEWTFPIQAALGIGGNSITLIVLLSRNMRSRTNTMLAMAAMCDILYLIFMCPLQLSRWPSAIFVPCTDLQGQLRKCFSHFAHFYVENKTHFTFLVNWFSAASTWLIVVVSFDRLWAIKAPFFARSNSGCTRKECIIIPLIFLFTGGISFHMNFSFGVSSNSTGPSTIVSTQKPVFIHVLTILNLVMHILIPMFLLISLNSCLIYYLKNRRTIFEPKRSRGSRNSNDLPAPLLNDNNGNTDRSDVARHHSANSGIWFRHVGKAERHVTVTVTAIVTCYIISHIPSAGIYAYMYLWRYDTFYQEGWMYTMVAVSTAVVTFSKVANFLLFCMSSKHFRLEMERKICYFCRKHQEVISFKDSANQHRTRSLQLNVIADSTNNNVSE